MEFFGHGGAAGDLAAVDHGHAQPGHRQIGRAGEAVMARADDQYVGFGHVRFIVELSFRGDAKHRTRNAEIPDAQLRI